ncbi:hypothetical protein [Cellulosilyticum lentocellum]|uniref:Uncharacterized protein n=1 Tax=Cellulosilyticum lentocellum (strain ATCC 49066 / DSM 5427 / NCIMB 11756 / RHM5) TaxID=642492 RepID=F2JKH4_CELLD|nr:hypothetical protein [Cellulosilyticum lentocellum]ADZ82134.1 hypothetical protein Clole_0390 [Cellulosilyticum lentocellum DSM 5427]
MIINNNETKVKTPVSDFYVKYYYGGGIAGEGISITIDSEGNYKFEDTRNEEELFGKLTQQEIDELAKYIIEEVKVEYMAASKVTKTDGYIGSLELICNGRRHYSMGEFTGNRRFDLIGKRLRSYKEQFQ